MKMTCEKMAHRHWELFGLTRNPFPVAPDVESFFISGAIDRLVTEIVHGILARKGFMVLTGEVGLGKTTIGRKILTILEEQGVETSLLFQTSYEEADLLREINRDFGLASGAPLFSEQMEALNAFLLEQNRRGKNCAIIIDDAQNLSLKSLELIRMISNLEADGEKLVQILLIGQRELLERLNSPELRQLRSRVVIRREVAPFSRKELENYLQFKLNGAGSQGLTTVSKAAVGRAHRLTRGNARRINILMDRAMYVAFLRETRDITRAVVQAAHEDLGEKGRRLPRKGFALAASLALLLAAAVSLGITRIPERRPTQDGPAAAASLPQGTKVPDVQGGATEETTKSVTGTDVEVAQAVGGFLNEYGLIRYREAFLQALHSGEWSGIRQEFLDKTGYLLTRLPKASETMRRKAGVLKVMRGVGGEPSVIVLWRPPFRVDKFYMGFRGPEIVMLQERLQKAGLYEGNLDGIVGPRLMAAVVHYQEGQGMPVNGYPDDPTLFLLNQEEG